MTSKTRPLTVLALLVGVAALALAGVSLAGGDKGHHGHHGHHGRHGHHGKGEHHSSGAAQYQYGSGAAQYQYGSGAGQYGGHKVLLCHKGRHTISVGQPAVKAHLRHGDTLGTCR